MAPHKEPNFFNHDDPWGVSTLEEYEILFRGATDEHIAVGEASVFYLSSLEATRNVLRYQPDARFIVMVRNPIEMAPALHAELLLHGVENVPSFSTAWRLQEERRRGRRLPLFCRAPRWLLYGDVCCVGAQLERLRSSVPTDRIVTTVLDDLRQNPRREYLRVLTFLGVPDDGRLSFPIYNAARGLRLGRLPRILCVLSDLKRAIGIQRSFGVWPRIDALNQVERPRDPPSPEMTVTLKEYFLSDVERLGQLLNRNFSGWLT
jgi:hypothetical protein